MDDDDVCLDCSATFQAGIVVRWWWLLDDTQSASQSVKHTRKAEANGKIGKLDAPKHGVSGARSRASSKWTNARASAQYLQRTKEDALRRARCGVVSWCCHHTRLLLLPLHGCCRYCSCVLLSLHKQRDKQTNVNNQNSKFDKKYFLFIQKLTICFR